MKLLLASDMATVDADAEGVYERLLRAADGFLRAGGNLSLDDWAQLTPAERASFIDAGNAIRVEQALITARGMMNEEYCASVEGAIWNDLSYEKYLLRKKTDEIIKKKYGKQTA
jgi:hypothetical protein